MKILGYRFTCPVCGWLSYTNKLYNRYNMELFQPMSKGKGKGFNYIPVHMDNHFKEEFQQHFKYVIIDLIKLGLIDFEFINDLWNVKQKPTITVKETHKIPVNYVETSEYKAKVKYKDGGE